MKIASLLQAKNPYNLINFAASILAVGMALVQFARFLYIAFSRATYPFSLEWMEGGSFVQVSRILSGQPLYVRPSFDFIPQIYPPLYFYISALLSKVLGNSFLPLRLVSIIATLGILMLIFLLVYDQSGSKLGGILATGLFCATYKLSGHWFDIGRVDSLALLLLLLSAYFVLKDKPITSIFGSIFLALSCFSKQTMLLVAGVFLVYCLFPFRKNGLIFIGMAVLVFLSGTVLLDRLYDGWYSYYVFHLPGRHNVLPNLITLIVSTKDILYVEIIKPVFVAAVIGFIYLFLFPEKGKTAGNPINKTANQAWLKRSAWSLVLLTGLLAVGSLWYLVYLPSDASRGTLGPYSLARLILMAGPVIAVGMIVVFLIKVRKDPTLIVQFAQRLFGDIRVIPRILMGTSLLVFFSIVTLTYIRPGLFEGLTTAYLQRLYPYLVGPVIILVTTGCLWRLLWPTEYLEVWFFLLLVFGLIAVSWLGRLNPGGYLNVFMPAYAGITILFGLGVGSIVEMPPEKAFMGRNVLNIVLLLLSSAQLIVLLAPVAPQIPSQADKEAGQELVRRIAACPGEVYVPFHTYLAELAGKKGYAGVVEMGELKGSFGGKADPLWDEVLSQIRFSLDTDAFAAIIQDNQLFHDAMSSNYVETGQIFEGELVFWPVSGRKVRPSIIYEPNDGGGCSLNVK